MDRRRTGARFGLACGGLIALWIAAYGNSLPNAFQFDDDHVISRNLYIRELRNIPLFFRDGRTFSTFPQNATYRPLVSATLAIDYAIAGGLQPVAFHVDQLIQFFLLGVLFFFVVRALLRQTGDAPWHPWAALFCAGFFCLHTGNTETANYITVRSELLSALGVLGAFLLYLEAPRLRWLHLFLIPMAIGALAKPPAVIFGPLLLTYKLIFEAELSPASLRTREGWKQAGRAVLTSVPTLLASALVFRFLKSMDAPEQTYGGTSPQQYLWTQTFAWLRYFKLFVLPTGLSADTDLKPFATWQDPRVAAGVLVLIVTLVLAILATSKREYRLVALGILWFWLGIAPTSSVMPLAEMTNDHRMFLGWFGLTLAVGTFAFERASAFLAKTRHPDGWRRALGVAAILLLVAHAVGTHERNRVWHDNESLWADTAEKSPTNGRGLMNYGLARMARGDYPAARNLFERAAEFVPFYSVLAVNRAIVTSAMGDKVGAEPFFRRALTLEPVSGSAPFFYARFLVEQGRAAEALPLLERAQKLDWSDPSPRHLALELAAARGDQAQVQAIASRTLALGPDAVAKGYLQGKPPFTSASDDAKGWFDTGLKYTSAKQHALAAQAYRIALARNPAYADAWNNLGWSLLSLGFAREAAPAFERVLALDAGYALARNNLLEAQRRMQ